MQTKADQFDTDLGHLAEQAKALSHPARLEILRVIAAHEECICGEVVDELPLAQSTVSRHLRVLKDAGLIQGTIDGPSICYCLNPPILRALSGQMEAFFDEVLYAEPDPSSC